MANIPTKFDAIIIDPDLDTRMRLKAATTSVHQFGKVTLVNSSKEAVDTLVGRDMHCDVVFISHSITREETTSFIKEAKASKRGQDSAFVLVLKTKDQDSSTVAQNVLMGADGFLFEPYSVDNLVEITQLSARVKKERSETREAGAIKFLLNDIMQQIDLIAYLKGAGYDVGRGIKRFKDMCGVLKTFEGSSRDLYMKLVVDVFEAAPFPKKIYEKNYAGASSRLKKKAEQKMLEQLEAGMAGDDSTKA